MASVRHGGKACGLVCGRTVFDYADELAVQVPTSCGRAGVCHECVVEIEEGMEALRPRTTAEEFLRGNFRLACQAVIEREKDVRFSLMERRPQLLAASRQGPPGLDPPAAVRVGTVLYDGE